jgi:transposase-like protein
MSKKALPHLLRGPPVVSPTDLAIIARKSDGRRIFANEFKREQMGRVWRGDVTLAELSRELGIARSLLQRWKRLLPPDGDGAEGPRRYAIPATDTRAGRYIRELELLVGKQTVELEHLRAELDRLKKRRRSSRR